MMPGGGLTGPQMITNHHGHHGPQVAGGTPTETLMLRNTGHLTEHDLRAFFYGQLGNGQPAL